MNSRMRRSSMRRSSGSNSGASNGRPPADAHGKVRGTFATGSSGDETPLDDAILERVIRDHCNSPSGSHPPNRVIESLLQRGELSVDGDSDGLKRPTSRVTIPAGRRRNRPRDDRSKLPGVLDRSGRDDGRSDSPCKPLFSVASNDVCELFDVPGVDDVTGSAVDVVTHAHVERTSCSV